MKIFLHTEHCFGPFNKLEEIPNCNLEQACAAVGSEAYASTIKRIIAQDGERWAVVGRLDRHVSEEKVIVKPENLVWGNKPNFLN